MIICSFNSKNSLACGMGFSALVTVEISSWMIPSPHSLIHAFTHVVTHFETSWSIPCHSYFALKSAALSLKTCCRFRFSSSSRFRSSCSIRISSANLEDFRIASICKKERITYISSSDSFLLFFGWQPKPKKIYDITTLRHYLWVDHKNKT